MAVQDSALKSFVIVEKKELDDILDYDNNEDKLNNFHENFYNQESDTNSTRVISQSQYDGILSTYDPLSNPISKNNHSFQFLKISSNSTELNSKNSKNEIEENNIKINSNANSKDLTLKKNSGTLLNSDGLHLHNGPCDDSEALKNVISKQNSEDNKDIHNINDKSENKNSSNRIIDTNDIEKDVIQIKVASKNEKEFKEKKHSVSLFDSKNNDNDRVSKESTDNETNMEINKNNQCASKVDITPCTDLSSKSCEIIKSENINNSILTLPTNTKLEIIEQSHKNMNTDMQKDKEVGKESSNIINNEQIKDDKLKDDEHIKINNNIKDNASENKFNDLHNDNKNINILSIQNLNVDASKNNGGSFKRRVTFPEGEDIVSGYMDAPIPWRDASVCTTDHMLTAYLSSCHKHSIKPLYSLINQLKAIGNFTERNETLTLRNENLDARQCECLEEVLSRVQFRTIDLENTHLDDEGAIIMFDMIEYYESCLRMNIYMNASIETRGWQACSHLIRKSSSLEQVDLGCTNISEHMLPFMVRAFKTAPCLTILRLENAMMAGRPLATLVLALKVNNTLRQLFLGNNKLSSMDCIQLHSLLNFNRSLKLLDLRNNNCQDAGMEQISSGLLEQSREVGGLETLVLWNNMITYQSMPYLARALMETKALLGLNLGMNQGLTNEGVHCLKDSLVRNRSLLKIGLQSCRLTCEGAVAIAEYIAETTTLLRVDLRGNEIRTGGMMALTLSLKVNQSVLQLDIDKTPKKENKLKNFLSQQKQLLVDITNYVNRNNKLHTQAMLKRRLEEEECKLKEKEDGEKRKLVKDENYEASTEEVENKEEAEIKKDNVAEDSSIQNDEEIKDKEEDGDGMKKDLQSQSQQQPSDQQHQQKQTHLGKNDSDKNPEPISEETLKNSQMKEDENNNIIKKNNNVTIPISNLAQQQTLRTKLSLDLQSEQSIILELLNSASSPPSPSSLLTTSSTTTTGSSDTHGVYPPQSFHTKPQPEFPIQSVPPSIHPVPPSPMVMSDGVATLRSVSVNNLINSPSDLLPSLLSESQDGGCSSGACGSGDFETKCCPNSVRNNCNISNSYTGQMDCSKEATNDEMHGDDENRNNNKVTNYSKTVSIDASLSGEDCINQIDDLLNDQADNEGCDGSFRSGSSSSWRSASSGSNSSINNEVYNNATDKKGFFSVSGIHKEGMEKHKTSTGKHAQAGKKTKAKAKKKRFVVTPTTAYHHHPLHRHPLHLHVNNKNNIVSHIVTGNKMINKSDCSEAKNKASSNKNSNVVNNIGSNIIAVDEATTTNASITTNSIDEKIEGSSI